MKLFLLLLTGLLFFSNLKNAQSNYSKFDYFPIERPNGHSACYNKIRSEIKNPGVLNIAVGLGYSDYTDEHSDLVSDVFTLNTLIHILKNPCVYKNQGFCDFKFIDGRDHEVQHYSRDILTIDGKILTVNIYMMNSSFSIGNANNKTKYRVQQEEQTLNAQNFFAWGIQNADMVFYEGHSRDGGGPDFAPPHPTSTGAVNYNWYHANRIGLKFLLNALDEAQIKPMTLGLFSCASRGHFLNSLKQHTSTTKFVLSTHIVEAGNTKLALMRTLESVLNFECDSDLKARIKTTSFVIN
jgi:hypothetical protein